MNYDTSDLLNGHDISKWQFGREYPLGTGRIVYDLIGDYRKMKADGASFVVHKASQADYWDPAFITNWKASNGILPRSTYHFYDNSVSPKTQAKRYWKTIQEAINYAGGIHEGMYWLDLEDKRRSPYFYWLYWYDWLEEFKSVSGVPTHRIGIYSNYYYLTDALRMATTREKAYFKNYKYWPAHYFSNPANPNLSVLKLPEPYKDEDVIMIQTGTPPWGRRRGLFSEDVDYNVTTRAHFEIMFPNWIENKSDIRIRIRSAA